MSFPSSPANNAVTIVNGITYRYTSATNTWVKIPGNYDIAAGNLTVSGTLGVTGDVTGNKFSSATGFFWSNGVAYSSSASYGNTQVEAYLPNSTVISAINANVTAANVAISGLNYYDNANVETYLPVSTVITGIISNAATQEDEISALRANITAANTAISNNAYGNAEVAVYLPTNTTIINLYSNATSQAGEIANLYADIAAANIAISTKTTYSNIDLSAFLPSDTTITGIISNAATQEDEISALRANIEATNSSIVNNSYSNLSVEAYLPLSVTITDIGNLIAVVNANVTAANSTISGLELYSNTKVETYLPTSTVIIGLQSNAATQEDEISALRANIESANASISASIYSNVDLAAYLPLDSTIIDLYSNASTQSSDIANLQAAISDYAPIIDPVFTNDVTIQGNLIVNGNSTTINTTNLSLNDPIIFLANSNTTNTVDIGFVGEFNSEHTGLIRQASNNTWRLFSGVVPQPDTTVDFTSYVKDNLLMGNLDAVKVTAANVATANSHVSSGLYANAVYTNSYLYANGTTLETGIKSTADTTAPASPSEGDEWYDTTNDILYRYTLSGGNSFWVDISSSTLVSAPSTAINTTFELLSNFVAGSTVSGGGVVSAWNIPYTPRGATSVIKASFTATVASGSLHAYYLKRDTTVIATGSYYNGTASARVVLPELVAVLPTDVGGSPVLSIEVGATLNIDTNDRCSISVMTVNDI